MAAKIRVTRSKDGVFELNLHDPENQNRLSSELLDELKVNLTELAPDSALKVLVVTGMKDVFCAGATVQVLRQLSSGTYDEDVTVPLQVLGFPLPVIGALEGHAVGGGLAFAVCCDVVVAAETSRYGFNFTSMGFTPGIGTTALVPALVGSSFGAEMLLTAKFYKGRDLKGRGLFNHVVPVDQVRQVAWDLARCMADKPRSVLEMLKQTLAAPRLAAFQEAFVRECAMHKECFKQPDIWSMINGNYMGNS